MYKKLIDLRNMLEAEKIQLDGEIRELQAIAEEREPRPFDELSAANRINEAKKKDYLEGTNVTGDVMADIDKMRDDKAKQLEEFALRKANAISQLSQKNHLLASTNTNISKLEWEIKELENAEAKKRMAEKIADYKKNASSLLNDLIEIDALNAIIEDDPSNNSVKHVLRIEPLPSIGLDDAYPWQVQVSGQSLVFPHQFAFQAVHDKRLTLIEEIKGELYAN